VSSGNSKSPRISAIFLDKNIPTPLNAVFIPMLAAAGGGAGHWQGKKEREAPDYMEPFYKSHICTRKKRERLYFLLAKVWYDNV
jgi:hypothetical protein